ncbi:protein SPA1-RELATED 3-like [Hibiscus syriacus]|uniref:Protein SPA1-RELATED 3-like n=1 Tax=Hibiscus syriacus TaxID=106335 RepID=A0A6A2YED4_HIBSY|nr:protein SPA1-RELATED 3-like [Hibiscus syriacus]
MLKHIGNIFASTYHADGSILNSVFGVGIIYQEYFSCTTQTVSSPEGYFQTVVCNVPEFAKTVVNHDMHYISWDTPPKQHPHILNINDTDKIIRRNAPFARKFIHDDPVLDKIDTDLLGRENRSFNPGDWCSGKPTCTEVGDSNMIRPGPGAQRLNQIVTRLVMKANNGQDQCR